ncbi:hypothetical protein ACP70R_043623 [Stipagrostis hirtigluma subsp. patula]
MKLRCPSSPSSPARGQPRRLLTNTGGQWRGAAAAQRAACRAWDSPGARLAGAARHGVLPRTVPGERVPRRPAARGGSGPASKPSRNPATAAVAQVAATHRSISNLGSQASSVSPAAAAADHHSPPPRRLVFAFYLTDHGFGHATRAIEVARHLVAAGHEVHMATGVPEFIFTSVVRSPRLRIRRAVLDCGAIQADALTVDPLASLQKYHETAVVPRESILRAEVEWLTSIKADLAVSDVVPVACRAAADAGIRSVCIANYGWDFIYEEYIIAAGYHHQSIVCQIVEDYSHCDIVLRLPGYCPMPAFRDVIDVPLVVRGLRKSRSEVRKELGISEDAKVLIFNFGGQPTGWKLKQEWLPDGWICLVCGASDSHDVPLNFIKLAKDAYTPDVMAASDCMLGKIGYGTTSERYQGCIEMTRRDFLTGNWKPYLLHAITLEPCYNGPINGGEVAAQILQDIADGKKCISGEVRDSA